jgi:asparagine synthase (glutamine-hydrolysing)
MCGISLIVSKDNSPVPEAKIAAITDKIIHRGPDDYGYFYHNNFAFGHRRLSIIDLSQGGHQPMISENLSIVYNGEIFNYIELRKELQTLGHAFKTESDTEVILVAYKEWGIRAFDKLNGMWAFAIADTLKNEILLCRDRYGIKPLYYCQTKNYFLAGSEIKQFTALEEFEPILNKEVAVNFLVNGLLNYSTSTFFEGVNELRPGSFLQYNLSNHSQKVTVWYDLRKKINPNRDTYLEATFKLRSLLIDSIKLRMRSDVPVGCCLSGGLDSSSIVSVIKSHELEPPWFSTITACFNDERHNEQPYSDTVTEMTGFKSHKIFPELKDLFNKGQMDTMIYHHDQPFSGGTHFLEFCVYKAARQLNLTVMQGGQGPDEYLGGYDDYYYAYATECLRKFRLKKFFDFFNERSANLGVHFGQELIAYIRSVFWISLSGKIKSALGINSFTWLSTPYQLLAKNALVYYRNGSIKGLSLNQMMYNSLPYQMHSEDRNSMLFSVESRLPFLDHRLVEYGIALPSHYKLRKGVTKRVLRDAVSELPESIRERKHKMGFVSPDAEWLVSQAPEVRKQLKEAIVNSGFFTVDLLINFDRFVEGEANFSPLFFRAIALNRFLKIFSMKVK